jgi:hypothetical protein
MELAPPTPRALALPAEAVIFAQNGQKTPSSTKTVLLWYDKITFTRRSAIVRLGFYDAARDDGEISSFLVGEGLAPPIQKIAIAKKEPPPQRRFFLHIFISY